MKKRLLVLATVVGVVGSAAGFGATVTPTLLSVSQVKRHPYATFSALHQGSEPTIYFASKPDRATDGSFLSENIVASDSLTDAEIQGRAWSYEDQLDPGRYFAMLKVFDWSDPCSNGGDCIEGYSNVLPLTIPKPPMRFRSKVEVLRYIGIVYLTLSVTPLGEKLPYKVCWRTVKGRRCVRGKVDGYSWVASADDSLRVRMRGMRRRTTFNWYASGRKVASKRVATKRAT